MRMQGKEGYDEHYATMATHNYYGLEGAARLREYQIIFDGMWVTLLFLRIVFYRRPITPMITRFMSAIRQAILTIVKSFAWLIPFLIYCSAVTRLHFGIGMPMYSSLGISMKSLGRMILGDCDYDTFLTAGGKLGAVMFMLLSLLLAVMLYNYILSVFFAVFFRIGKDEGAVIISSETATVHEEDKLVEDKDVGKFARILREELIRHNKIKE